MFNLFFKPGRDAGGEGRRSGEAVPDPRRGGCWSTGATADMVGPGPRSAPAGASGARQWETAPGNECYMGRAGEGSERARKWCASSFVKKRRKEGRRKGDFMPYVARLCSSSKLGCRGAERLGAPRSGAERPSDRAAARGAPKRARAAARSAAQYGIAAARSPVLPRQHRTRDSMKVKSCQVI